MIPIRDNLATSNTVTGTQAASPPRPSRCGPARSLYAQGEPMIWLIGGGLAVALLMIVGLLALVVYQGIATFWPVPVVRLETANGVVMGEVTRGEYFVPHTTTASPAEAEGAAAAAADQSTAVYRRLVRTGNFELTGTHFHWVAENVVRQESRPPWALTIERLQWGRFYGEPVKFLLDGREVASDAAAAWALFEEHFPTVADRRDRRRRLESRDIGHVNAEREAARLRVRTAELRHGAGSPEHQRELAREAQVLEQTDQQFARIRGEIQQLNADNERYKLVLLTAQGNEVVMPLDQIVRAYPANRLSFSDKLGIYFSRWWEYISDEPREANSEGGVFPAIFGTMLMTILMSLAVVPFGVLAALYLREYARAGPIVSAVRIAINNLAGVPSIVFGVFGLGFFSYTVGAYIDGGARNIQITPWPRSAWLAALGLTVAAAVAGPAIWFTLLRSVRQRAGVGRYLGLLVGLWVLAVVGLLLLLVSHNPYFDGLFQAKLPAPTFGTGGLIWASLTLALLTLPVVIVATEEALAAVPSSMREGAYACGASKWQTIGRIVMPRAMPGIMTGMILAMARGAGEVAPLMLVGAVKLAPELPGRIDRIPPYVHIESSFMHLGFHIYDLGFQSQNSEAAKPMVFTTTLLLIGLIIVLNMGAMLIRARLRRAFLGAQF